MCFICTTLTFKGVDDETIGFDITEKSINIFIGCFQEMEKVPMLSRYIPESSRP